MSINHRVSQMKQYDHSFAHLLLSTLVLGLCGSSFLLILIDIIRYPYMIIYIIMKNVSQQEVENSNIGEMKKYLRGFNFIVIKL